MDVVAVAFRISNRVSPARGRDPQCRRDRVRWTGHSARLFGNTAPSMDPVGAQRRQKIRGEMFTVLP